MTEPTMNNTLYKHLHGRISRARQLEHTIRASRLGSEAELAQLASIDTEMRQRWIALGLTSEETHRESLMDMTWDIVQTGQLLNRLHGRRFSRELHDLIVRGLETIPGDFVAPVRNARIPATRTYRICDLLNGNDIGKLMGKVVSALTEARRYAADDEIGLEKFVLDVRAPILIHPAFRFADWNERQGGNTIEYFGFALDTQADVPVAEVRRQIREFLYQFALHKESRYGKNLTSDALIEECLKEESEANADEAPNLNVNQFMSTLCGLYCWDRAQMYKKDENAKRRRSFLSSAITDTLDNYPRPVRMDDPISSAAVKSSYYDADAAISLIFRRLYSDA